MADRGEGTEGQRHRERRDSKDMRGSNRKVELMLTGSLRRGLIWKWGLADMITLRRVTQG